MVRTGEIVPGDVSGGTNTSHTIIVPAVTTLLNAQSLDASFEDYERAVLEDNVLSKDTEGARRRTFRYLKELYVLRPTSILFRALRDLWSDDVEAQPLLAGSCALARDAVFRASSTAIFNSSPGEALVSADLASAVGEHIPRQLQRGDSGEDRPEHLFQLGTDWPSGEGRRQHQGAHASGLSPGERILRLPSWLP